MDYRSALITGASSGLGRGLALWFARRKVKVYAAARRVKQLEALRDEAHAFGGEIEVLELDVRQTAKTVETLQRLDERVGGLDLVIANAGVAVNRPSAQISWAEVEHVLQVNVMGAAATLSTLVAPMKRRGRGHLVGISSLAAYRGLPGSVPYCASKAFLKTYLEGLRVELKPAGVRVTSIHPGFVKTEGQQNEFQMPLMLEVDDACERMGRAIVRGASEYRFPRTLSLGTRLLEALPNPVFDFVLTRGSVRKKLEAGAPPPAPGADR